MDRMPCPKCGKHNAERKSAAYFYRRADDGNGIGELLQTNLKFECACGATFSHTLNARSPDGNGDALDSNS
jgi:hypothetical protein